MWDGMMRKTKWLFMDAEDMRFCKGLPITRCYFRCNAVYLVGSNITVRCRQHYARGAGWNIFSRWVPYGIGIK